MDSDPFPRSYKFCALENDDNCEWAITLHYIRKLLIL